MSFDVIGTKVERIDARAKATGAAKFTVDTQPTGAVFAKFLRSPHPHARVVSVDVSEALATPGVVAAVTQFDVAGRRLHNDTLDDVIRYTGEAVVGVAAESEDAAEAALDKVVVTYELLPVVLGYDEALDPALPDIWPGGNLCTWRGPEKVEPGKESLVWEKGDTDKAMREAYATASCTVETHVQFHGCLEPHACVASWDAGAQMLRMNISTQGIFDDQENLAHALGLKLDQVQVQCTYVGGGFGSKCHNTCKEYLFSALLSQKCSRPVRYTPTRAEECITALRHAARFTYEMGAAKDGTVTSIKMKALRSGGAHTSLQMNFLLGSTEYVAPTYLRSDNVKYEGVSLYTTLPLCAAYRGFGYFEGGIGFAQVIDMLAEKLGMDPVEFLMKNVPVKGDPVSTDQGPLTTGGVRECVEAAAKAIGWREKRHAPRAKRLHDGRMHGIAVAHAMGRATLPNFVTTGNAVVQIKRDGSVRVFAGISDMGQGQATGLKQIAAEAVGVPFDAVTVTWGDTVAPHTGDQVASSTTMMTGNAVKLAGADAKAKLLAAVAPRLKKAADELDIKRGYVICPGDESIKMSVAEAVSTPGVLIVTGVGHWSITDAEASPRAVVACAVEVAVDEDTGVVEVLDMVQSTDCGRAVSRSRIEGQLDAVLSGGVGYTLTEEFAMDKSLDARVLNANLYDYKMPTALDTVNKLQKGIILEYPDETGPFGARGMGEATLSASAPAILNAVYNAIGIRFDKTPLTPDRVLEALSERRKAQ